MDVASLAIQIKTGDVQKGVKELDKLTEAGKKAERATDTLTTTFSGMSGVLRTVGTGLTAAQVINYVDQYTKFTAQLRLATTSAADFGNALSEVRRISNESQTSLAETSVLYARIANGTRELGVSQQQLSEITETVNLSLKVSGATAQESASAMLQLSQAFASGVLRGEEFNAVNEAAPRLMKALADGLGVPVGALRKMAEQGLITSEVMATVLPKSLQGLKEEAKNVQTISGAFQVLQNNVMEFVGESANANGSAKALAGSIVAIGESINFISSAAIGFGAVKLSKFLYESSSAALTLVAANRAAAAATLESAKASATATAATAASTAARVTELRSMVLNAEGAVALAVATNGLIPAQARATAAAEAHAVATANLAVAQRAASVSGALASGALGLLGGPIGAITTVLGLGVTAWLLWGDSANKSEAKATGIVEKSTQEIVADLDRQIEKLKERNALAGAGGIEGLKKQESESVQRLARLQAQIKQVQEGTGDFANLSDAGRADVLGKLTKQFGELYGRIQAVDEQQKILASGSTEDLIKAKMRLAGVEKSYFEDLKTYQDALKKGQITEKEYIKIVSDLATETYKKSAAGEYAKKSTEELTKELEKQSQIVLRLNGFDKEFVEDWNRLGAIYKSGKISVEQLVEAQQQLLQKQEAIKKNLENEAALRENLVQYYQQQQDQQDKNNSAVADFNETYSEYLQNIEFETGLLSKSEKQKEKLIALRRLENDFIKASKDLSGEELDNLTKIYELNKQKLGEAIDKKQAESLKILPKDLESDLKQAFMLAFQDSKDPAQAFVDGLANAIFSRVSASLANALADAALKTVFSGGGGGSDLFGSLLSLGSMAFGNVSTAMQFGTNIGSQQTSMLAAQVAGFEGGGFTGSGSRSGGMDGRGGFMAMLHPNETVIDHTKGGAGQVVYAPVIQIDSRTDRGEVMRLVQSAVQNGNNQLVDRLQRQGRI